MIGDTWPSEMHEFRDEKTGRRVLKLTSTGNNYHLYFTENSFDCKQNEIIFLSDRASGQDRLPQDDPHYNLFRMDLASGVITQLTDEPDSVGSVTKTPDSALVVYKTGNQIKKLDMATGQSQCRLRRNGQLQPGRAVHRPQPALHRLLPQREGGCAARAELHRLQGIVLPDQGRPHHRGLPGWLRLVRRLQGHALGRPLPVLPRRQHHRLVLPRRAVEPGDAAHLAARLRLARGQAVLPPG